MGGRSALIVTHKKILKFQGNMMNWSECIHHASKARSGYFTISVNTHVWHATLGPDSETARERVVTNMLDREIHMHKGARGYLCGTNRA
jgi:hypothetical protein